MGKKYWFQVFLTGMAIFSMFFGGGNLTFPLWIGSETSSIFLAASGFIFSGVILPFFGMAITLFFKGNYEECFAIFGKPIGRLLAFTLLLFWIPLGSGPRCNQLAYGAFCCQTDWNVPIWMYSALYSILVYMLTLWKKRFLDILGNVITPILIISITFIVISVFVNFDFKSGESLNLKWNEFYLACVAGYSTMDFIAAIFFASTVISIMKDVQKDRFNINFVRDACIFAVVLLSIVYVGMISVGHAHAQMLSMSPKDRFLALLATALFDEKFQPIIFVIITLSVLSTSMALALVFSEYLKKTIFKEKVDYKICLFISIFISFMMSVIGFERLALLISYVMAALYPILFFVTTVSLVRKKYIKRKHITSEYI